VAGAALDPRAQVRPVRVAGLDALDLLQLLERGKPVPTLREDLGIPIAPVAHGDAPAYLGSARIGILVAGGRRVGNVSLVPAHAHFGLVAQPVAALQGLLAPPLPARPCQHPEQEERAQQKLARPRGSILGERLGIELLYRGELECLWRIWRGLHNTILSPLDKEWFAARGNYHAKWDQARAMHSLADRAISSRAVGAKETLCRCV
jgi:hypothetical protein